MEHEKVIQALKNGAILGADWNPIDEMLGLEPEQILKCALYENTGNFLPNLRSEFEATESELSDILREADVNWMADDYPVDRGLLGHITTRFFAVKEPKRVRWMENPNKL